MQPDQNDRKAKKLLPVERAKKRLQAYRDLQESIDFKTERLARMEERLESFSSQQISDMPRVSSGIGDRMAVAVARKIDLEEEVRQDIARERAEYEAIRMIAGTMERADERTVIQLRYLDGAKWDEISKVLYQQRDDFSEKSEDYLRQTFRKHGRAIRSFAEAEELLMERKEPTGKEVLSEGL